jgi:hypothetical protein
MEKNHGMIEHRVGLWSSSQERRWVPLGAGGKSQTRTNTEGEESKVLSAET